MKGTLVTGTGPWTGSSRVPLGPRQSIARAEWAIDRLERFLGIKVPANSRLPSAARLLDDVQENRRPLSLEDPDLLEEVHDATRTIWEQFLIVHQIMQRPKRTRLRGDENAKLEMMLSGHPIERLDKNPLARNTQFELFVAAMLRVGGLDVSFEEPDLRMQFLRNESIGVAAKRLGAAGKLERRVKGAVEQIERSEIRGLVALNLDVLMRDMTPRHEDPEDAGSDFNRSVQRMHEMIPSLEHQPRVVGVANFGIISGWRLHGDGTPQLAMSFFRQFAWFLDEAHPDWPLLEQLTTGYMARAANWMRVL